MHWVKGVFTLTNDEFKKLVLEKLGSIESELKETKNKVTLLEKTVNAIHEQTEKSTEFKEEANKKLDTLIEDNKSIHGIIGEHEVSIRTLRRHVI